MCLFLKSYKPLSERKIDHLCIIKTWSFCNGKARWKMGKRRSTSMYVHWKENICNRFDIQHTAHSIINASFQKNCEGTTKNVSIQFVHFNESITGEEKKKVDWEEEKLCECSVNQNWKALFQHLEGTVENKGIHGNKKKNNININTCITYGPLLWFSRLFFSFLKHIDRIFTSVNAILHWIWSVRNHRLNT